MTRDDFINALYNNDDGLTLNQIEQIEGIGIKASRQKGHYLIYKPMKDKSGNGSKETYEECQNKHEHALADVSCAPCVNAGNKRNDTPCSHFRISAVYQGIRQDHYQECPSTEGL